MRYESSHAGRLAGIRLVPLYGCFARSEARETGEEHGQKQTQKRGIPVRSQSSQAGGGERGMRIPRTNNGQTQRRRAWQTNNGSRLKGAESANLRHSSDRPRRLRCAVPAVPPCLAALACTDHLVTRTTLNLGGLISHQTAGAGQSSDARTACFPPAQVVVFFSGPGI